MKRCRRFGQIDALIRHFVPKPPAPQRAGSTPEILLAGVCELLFLDVAAHAAVDSANRLCERDKNAVHFKPLVNAVLRRISREGKQVLEATGCATPQHAGLDVDAVVRRLWRRYRAQDREPHIFRRRRSILR